ncbi:MAG: MFS transporter [Psychrosphaera sp.]|nr:MFS transporter [Psychrosphaera sp.]
MSNEQVIANTNNTTTDKPRRSGIFSFGGNFYIANCMEILERLAWYGSFGILSLYLTAPVELGGLGATEQQRGTLTAVVMTLIYLLPVITGALGDRYGYRRMLMISFALMTPSYYMLGQVDTYGTFFLTYMVLAVGGAIFKPLIVGTVGRTTNDENRSLGFGLFYTMVNVGGFLGPLSVAYLREISWELAFTLASVTIAINFIPVIFFYKDPAKATVDASSNKSLKETLLEVQTVLGNGRLALTVVPILVLLLIPGTNLLSWTQVGIFCGCWLVFNFVWDKSASATSNKWYTRKIKFGNVPFLWYLLILSGFWVVYLQIFTSLNIFVRDFIDTRDLINFSKTLSPAIADFMSGANVDDLVPFIEGLSSQFQGSVTPKEVQATYFTLTNYSVMVPQKELAEVMQLSATMMDKAKATAIANDWVNQYQQIKPELITSVNFGSIVIFQLFVSKFSAHFKTFTVLVGGTLMLSLSYVFLGMAPSMVFAGTAVASSVLIFSIGEMLASPKSMEYIAKVMPQDQSAMYQGYLYLASAFGFLIGGLLSGVGYEYFAKTLNKPEYFWYLFAVIGVFSAIGLLMYDKFIAHKLEAQQQ